MGLFDKFKNNKKKAFSSTGIPSGRKSIFDCEKIKTDNWQQVFSACLGKMVAIQSACSTHIIKDRNWNVNFAEGVIAFGDDKYPMQFIGSESSVSNTWLWGWENINGFSDEITAFAEETKNRGEEFKLEPLTTAKFELSDTFNGHTLSIVACGISDRSVCYYRCPHDNGAVFVTFSGVPDEVFAPVDMNEFIDITIECIQKYHVDHRIFVESFLMWNGTDFECGENRIMARFNKDLIIEFEQADEFWRISRMHIPELN